MRRACILFIFTVFVCRVGCANYPSGGVDISLYGGVLDSISGDSTRRAIALEERVRRGEATEIRRERVWRENMVLTSWTMTDMAIRDRERRARLESLASGDEGGIVLSGNLLRWATLTPEVGVEWRVDRNWGVLVRGAWTSWRWKDMARRHALWNVSPEVRYYLGCEKRWYAGVYMQVGEFNYKPGDTGRQGDYLGGGVSAGYRVFLGRRWSLDFTLGAGYTRAEYEKYKVIDGVRVQRGEVVKDYVGINRVGVSLGWEI